MLFMSPNDYHLVRYMILVNCNSVSILWQWYVNMYTNRKETIIYMRVKIHKTTQRTQNTQNKMQNIQNKKTNIKRLIIINK